ncbi:MAG: hypothetical protein WC169_08750 [Dehalococcoidia bacterium]
MLNKKQGKQNNPELTTSSPRRVDLLDTVDSVVNKALTISADKMHVGNIQALIECLKKGDPIACSYCHYNIAKELGKILGIWDKDIRAVYAYGYDDNTTAEGCCEDVSPSSLIHMIIWAGRKTNALKALIESIDRAMVQVHRRLLGLKDIEHVLDIQVIDDDDVKNRKGYAALLQSIYQTPVKVWGGNMSG